MSGDDLDALDGDELDTLDAGDAQDGDAHDDLDTLDAGDAQDVLDTLDVGDAQDSMDDLIGASLREMLAAMTKVMPTTNISLEGLLSEFKAACGYSAKMPQADLVTHLGMLTQIQQRHLKSKLPDARSKLQPTDFAKLGIPVAVTKSKSKQGTPRPHIKFANSEVARLKREAVVVEDFTVARREATAEWKGMSIEERQRFLERDAEDGGDEEVEGDEVAETAWRSVLGSGGRWPLAPEHLEAAVSAVDGYGIQKRMCKLRWDRRQDVYVSSRNIVPEGALETILPCGQAHRGLCLTRDKRLFAEAVSVAIALGQTFAKAHVGEFLAFDNGKGVTYTLLAHKRARRPKVYTTHVFAILSKERADYLAFEQRSGKFLFMSQCGLAGHLIQGHMACAAVSVKNVEVNIVTTGLKLVKTSEAIGLWPYVKKPKAKASGLDDLDILTAATARKRSTPAKRGPKKEQPLSHNEGLQQLAAGLALSMQTGDMEEAALAAKCVVVEAHDHEDSGSDGSSSSDGSAVDAAAGGGGDGGTLLPQPANAPRAEIDAREAALAVPGGGRLHRRCGLFYRDNTRGEIFIAGRPTAMGQITGPFGDASTGLATGKISWSCKCALHGNKCTMLKTGKALAGDRERLVGWLLAGAGELAAGNPAQVHRGMWDPARWA